MNLEARRLMLRAERTNATRDKSDRSLGFAAPSDGPPDATLRTVIAALNAGVETADWNCVAEGLVMLGDLVDWHPWRGTA